MSKTSEAIDALFAALIEDYGPGVLEMLISGATKSEVPLKTSEIVAEVAAEEGKVDGK